MDINFILALAGFAVTFILLFVFAAKYREAAAHGCDCFPEDAPAGDGIPSVTAAIKKAEGNADASLLIEIEELKEKIKEMHYKNEELRLLTEDRTAKMVKAVARLETRLAAFEEEYVKKLQPTLVSLIEDLENMKSLPE